MNTLDVELRSGEVGRFRSKFTKDPSARELLHRGISHLYQGDRQNTSRARDLLERVDEIEPDAPVLLGMIAVTHWREARFGWSQNPLHSLKIAADYAQRAIELGDSEGIGHTILGYVRLQQRRHDEATETSVEALSRRPSCPMANGLLAEVMRYCGKADQSILRMREAMKLVGRFPPWMIRIFGSRLA